jgi:DNA-binding IclR family transcriptional regulator
MTQKEIVQSVDRALTLLDIVAEHGTISLTELSGLAKLNKATVHRLLATLIYKGYIQQNSQTGYYELTFKLFQLGNKKIEKMDSMNAVRSLISELSNKVEETVHLVVEDNKEVVYIDKFAPNRQTFMTHSRVGSRAPMYCTAVGKALLANYPDEVIKDVWHNSHIQQLTPNTITDFTAFMEEIAKVREHGYGMDHEENELGVFCIASVFYNYKGEIAGAFSISIPSTRFMNKTPHPYIERVLEYSKKISQLLGCEFI